MGYCMTERHAQQSAESRSFPPLQPVVQELKDKIDQEGWAHPFEEAIHCAAKYDLTHMKHIVSLSAYLVDINEWLFWIPRENASGDACYHRIAAFYLILNQTPLTSFQTGCSAPDEYEKPLTWLSQWLVRYAHALGTFLDSSGSINPETVQTFRSSHHLADYLEPEGGWTTFNSFFARRINPALRPIDSPSDAAVIVSPTDCRLEEHMEIREQSTVITKHIEWKVERLLGKSEYRQRFRGGIFLHASLAPNDYHRFHAPLSGRVLEATIISGQAALTLVLKHDPRGAAYLDFREAMDTPGFQAAQTRGVIILETAVGLLTIAAIGMAQVSSVILKTQQGQPLQKGQMLQKGDEMGYFQYGGSDIVLMCEARSQLRLSTQAGDYLKVGMKIGTAKVQLK